MATSRTLKLGLLADVTNYVTGMSKAESATRGSTSKMDKAVRRAGAAFAALGTAAGYAAIRIGKESVQAAIEDEASHVKLAKALRNTTSATNSQIASTEKWITSQQLAYGIADTKLRPAYATLARATKDLGQAQSLTTLAMDIAQGTGKDLEAVSLGLAKAYNGNLGALTRLGVPLDANIIKTKDFDAATKVLTETFGGSASAAADTYAGKMARMNESISEAKETLGQAFLPGLQKLVDYSTNTLIPTMQQVADGFAGKPKSVSNKLAQVGKDLGYGPDSGAYNLGKALRDVADSMSKLISAATSSDATGAVGNMQRIADALTSIANAIDKVADAWDNPAFKAVRKASNFINPLSKVGNILGSRATGGSVAAGGVYRVGEFGPETLVMGGASGSIRRGGGSGGNTYVFNGVIDGESARRSIERLMQNSSRRTGAVNLVGNTL